MRSKEEWHLNKNEQDNAYQHYIGNWIFISNGETNYKSKYLQRKELGLLKSNMEFGILLCKHVAKRKM